MKKKKNTSSNKTNKRWRPPKKFVSKKPQIKRQGPWRPKKHEKILLPQIPEKKENKVKDAIIWTLFIISFFIFWFSIYISQKEKIISLINSYNQNQNINNKMEDGEEPAINKEEPLIEELWADVELELQEPTIPTPIQDEKFLIIEQIYWAIKESNFDTLYTYVDNNLKQSTIFKTYFSKNRLQRFIDNIDNKNITVELINIDNETSKIWYNIRYSINNIPFIEEREVSFVTRDNGQKIAKIMCITKWCSTMPFFNPGKYF